MARSIKGVIKYLSEAEVIAINEDYTVEQISKWLKQHSTRV